MLRHLALTFAGAAVLLLAGTADAAAGKQCRDQKGHFIACAKPAAMASNGQRCRSSAGKFVKCPAAGMAANSKTTPKK